MATDHNLLIHLADTNTHSVRDRMLVLLAGLTSLKVDDLLKLTVAQVRELVASASFPHRAKVLRTLEGLEKHLPNSAGSSTGDELAFASRKHDPVTRAHKPIGRTQAWRVVVGALATLKARMGAFRALRSLSAPPPVQEAPVQEAPVQEVRSPDPILDFDFEAENEANLCIQAAWRTRHRTG